MRGKCAYFAIFALLITGCAAQEPRAGVIILNFWDSGGFVLEMRLEGKCAIVHTVMAGGNFREPYPYYVLPAFEDRLELMWARLRNLPQPPETNEWSYQLILERDGKKVREFLFEDDAERFPWWHGVLRELQVSARADIAYALAYRENTRHFASAGKWAAAGNSFRSALERAMTARQVQFAAELCGDVDDAVLCLGESESLFFRGEYREAVDAYEEAWDCVIGPWITVNERGGNVIEVSADDEVPNCDTSGLP